MWAHVEPSKTSEILDVEIEASVNEVLTHGF